MRYRAVTFDYWNTLIAETEAPIELRRALWAERLAEAGHEVTAGQLEAAFRHAWARFDERWRANQQSTAHHMAADAVAELGLDLAPDVVDDLADRYLEASLLTPRELLPDVEETLDRLRGLGLVVGIISDVGAVPGAQLRRWLDELGVHHLVDHFSFSDEVGAFKPHAQIFAHALAGLGVSEPASAAHVGDLRRTDVAGANRHGLTSVQYTGGRRDPADDEADSPRPDHVIGNHLELLDVLGLR